MYNRYVPNAQGSYDRQRIVTPRPESAPTRPPVPAPNCAATAKPTPPQHAKPQQNPKILPAIRLPERLDAGDLLVLVIILLLLQENEEDPLPLLITLAAFFLF